MHPFLIHLTHHSHCDLGYTHDLPVVCELQRRYIDQALDLIEEHADLGPDATFRWTCEVTSVVEHWLRTASPRQVERFLHASQRGQLEVCALWGNLTPLATIGQLAEMLAPLRRLRDGFGLSIRAAMNSDVNGFSWALAGLLADSGIEGLTMSINEHFGGAPKPFPGLFRWQTPAGKILPVWSGPTYAHTAWLGLGGPPDEACAKLRDFIARRKGEGWPHEWLGMQITHPGPQNDNMGPLAHLSPWVRAFNAEFGREIRLVITTPSRFFQAIRPDSSEAEIRTGEWNDWWSFGVGSTPYETGLFRRATAIQEEADLLSAVAAPPNVADLRPRAQDAAFHFIEHTWGADCSVSEPGSDDTRVQGRHKDRFAYDAFSLARILRRDGLGALADRITGPPGPAVVVFNPTPHPRTETLAVPRRMLESANLPPAADHAAAARRWPSDGAYQHFVDREFFGGPSLDEVGPVELAAFGWTVLTTENRAVPANNLLVEGNSASNGRITLSWHPQTLGLSRIEKSGRPWTATEDIPFGALIAEEIHGDRGTIMRFDDRDVPATTRIPVWNPSPPTRRHPASGTSCFIVRNARSIDLIQTADLPFTDGASIRWSLRADDDDITAEITLHTRKDPRPHGFYFALPFAFPEPVRLVAAAGSAVNPDRERIDNQCPWWCVQEGFCLGDGTASAAVATPDAPLIGFGKLPFGPAPVAGRVLSGGGFAWIWLTNNYWETNFRADDSGTVRFRVRCGFHDHPPRFDSLNRLASHARHPLSWHPLPEPPRIPPRWPATGKLFSFTSGASHMSGILHEPEAGTCRIILTNPADAADEVALGPGALHFHQAGQTDPEGRMLTRLPIVDQTVRISVPPRETVFLRVTPIDA